MTSPAAQPRGPLGGPRIAMKNYEWGSRDEDAFETLETVGEGTYGSV